ncbi:MAG TPA: hypothetical protein VM840_00825 [Actinomycetota bacterium]|nr:hypothetical protein [Actinomycetota bacterium]
MHLQQQTTQDGPFRRRTLPLGDGEEVSVLIGEENGQPRTVFMSYEAFCEVVGTMYTAIEALKAARQGVDLLGEPDEVEVITRPRLRVV